MLEWSLVVLYQSTRKNVTNANSSTDTPRPVEVDALRVAQADHDATLIGIVGIVARFLLVGDNHGATGVIVVIVFSMLLLLIAGVVRGRIGG